LVSDYLSTGFRRKHAGIEEEVVPAGVALADAEQRPETDRGGEIALVAAEVAACTKCGLSVNRTHAVPGEGSLTPPVLFIGEGPGEDEDKTGRPFVGKAGQYLDKWLESIGLDRKACYITNIVKCRPPQNREPRPEEAHACAPYLARQIAALKPKVIVCLGRIAAQNLLGTTSGVSALRGELHAHKGIRVVVTYHPSAVLRDQTLRRPVWEDMKLLKSLLS